MRAIPPLAGISIVCRRVGSYGVGMIKMGQLVRWGSEPRGWLVAALRCCQGLELPSDFGAVDFSRVRGVVRGSSAQGLAPGVRRALATTCRRVACECEEENMR
jgi:hypothetical protein